MKNKFSLFKIIVIIAVLAVISALTLPLMAADDNNLRLTKIGAASTTNAAATNYTSAIDLGSADVDDLWSQAYLKASIPALPNATNSATTLLFNLQTSTNNSTWTATSPLIQGQIAGASSATNTATVLKFPLPPDVKRYIRVQQIAPVDSGDHSAKTNVYQLFIP